MKKASKKLNSFRLLRAYCAIIVLLSHIPCNNIISGAFGVSLFMMMSGFFAMYSTAQENNTYLLKKLAKIIPLYWTVTIIISLTSMILPTVYNYTIPTFTNIIKSLVFIPYYIRDLNIYRPIFGSGWYLCIEFVFILIFSLFNKLKHSHRGLLASLTIITIYILGLVINNNLFKFYSSSYILFYALGITFYYIYLYINKNNLHLKISITTITKVIIFIFLLLISTIFSYKLPFFFINSLILFLFILISPYQNDNTIEKIGDISFSLYMIHEFLIKGFSRVIYSLDKLTIITILMILILICISILISKIIYEIYEKRIYNFIIKKSKVRKIKYE